MWFFNWYFKYKYKISRFFDNCICRNKIDLNSFYYDHDIVFNINNHIDIKPNIIKITKEFYNISNISEYYLNIIINIEYNYLFKIKKIINA